MAPEGAVPPVSRNGTVRLCIVQCAAVCGSVDVMYTEFFTSMSLLVFLQTEHRRRNWRGQPPTNVRNYTTDNHQSLCYSGGSSSIGSSSVLEASRKKLNNKCSLCNGNKTLQIPRITPSTKYVRSPPSRTCVLMILHVSVENLWSLSFNLVLHLLIVSLFFLGGGMGL